MVSETSDSYATAGENAAFVVSTRQESRSVTQDGSSAVGARSYGAPSTPERGATMFTDEEWLTKSPDELLEALVAEQDRVELNNVSLSSTDQLRLTDGAELTYAGSAGHSPNTRTAQTAPPSSLPFSSFALPQDLDFLSVLQSVSDKQEEAGQRKALHTGGTPTKLPLGAQ